MAKKCPFCAEEIAEGARVCKHCKRDLLKQCPHCAEEVNAQARVCPHCGGGLAGTAEGEELKEIKSKAPLVFLNIILPGLGTLIVHNEAARALQITGKNPGATPESINKKGLIQLIVFVVCSVGSIIIIPALGALAMWIWALIDTIGYYQAMTRV